MFPDPPDESLNALSQNQLCEIPLSHNEDLSLIIRVYDSFVETTSDFLPRIPCPRFLVFLKGNDQIIHHFLKKSQVENPHSVKLRDGTIFLLGMPRNDVPDISRILASGGVEIDDKDLERVESATMDCVRERLHKKEPSGKYRS